MKRNHYIEHVLFVCSLLKALSEMKEDTKKKEVDLISEEPTNPVIELKGFLVIDREKGGVYSYGKLDQMPLYFFTNRHRYDIISLDNNFTYTPKKGILPCQK